MKKKVLIFSLQYYPYVGGAEVALKELTDRLPVHEYEFHMITAHYDRALPKVEQVGNVLVHRIGLSTHGVAIGDLRRFPLHLNKYLYQVLAYRVACTLHTKHSYTLVWGMMAHATGIPAGLFKKRFPKVPYVLTLQEGDPLPHIEKTMRPVWGLFRNGFVRADRVQAISTFLGSWAVRMGFMGAPDIIPNGVDTARFAHAFTEQEQREAREKLQKKEGEVFLVTTSRLVHKNGIDTVIRALPQMPPSIIFMVYGIGPDEAMLRALAQELGVTERVRFMGQASHDELPRILAVSDMFIRPSRSEGMGNSFIEAMAAGLPVIATQEGGISDFLFDAERNPGHIPTGWAVDPEQPEQIVGAVERIMRDPDAARTTCENAKKLAIATYNWDVIVPQVDRLFNETSQVQ